MSKVFHKLFYHAIWTTHLRQSIINEDIEPVLYHFLENKALRYSCRVHAIGGVADHIHLAVQIPPSGCVSDIIGKLKGSSSYFLNKELQVTKNFSWQEGFGVLSFAEKDLPAVIRYVCMQKEHHRLGLVNRKMEETIEDEAGR